MENIVKLHTIDAVMEIYEIFFLIRNSYHRMHSCEILLKRFDLKVEYRHSKRKIFSEENTVNIYHSKHDVREGSAGVERAACTKWLLF